MFRFTIRELVLLTLVVGMGVGWWIDSNTKAADMYKSRELLQLYAEDSQIYSGRFDSVVDALEGYAPTAVTRDNAGVMTITTKTGEYYRFAPIKRPDLRLGENSN
jgi:hypothetical protein